VGGPQGERGYLIFNKGAASPFDLRLDVPSVFIDTATRLRFVCFSCTPSRTLDSVHKKCAVELHSCNKVRQGFDGQEATAGQEQRPYDKNATKNVCTGDACVALLKRAQPVSTR
jgi:hypothetical protein